MDIQTGLIVVAIASLIFALIATVGIELFERQEDEIRKFYSQYKKK